MVSPLRLLWQRMPAHVRAVLRAWRNKPTFPRDLQVEPTNRCNLKCIMCCHGISPPEKTEELGPEDFARVVDEVPSIQNVHLQGLGEPLLHSQLVEMIAYARAKGISTSLISNMTVMTDALAERLVRSGHGILAASIDSLDPEIVSRMRRGAKFDVLARIFDNIARVEATKKRLGSETPQIHVFSLILRHMAPRLPEFVQRLKELGVRQLSFQELCVEEMDPEARLPDGSRFIDEPIATLSVEEQVNILHLMQELNDDKMRVVPPRRLEKLEQQGQGFAAIPTCLDLWERPMIAVDGTVFPCCYCGGSADLAMGNVNEEPFGNIWFGQRFECLRLLHLLDRRPGLCKDCNQLHEAVEYLWETQGAAQRYSNIFLGPHPFSPRSLFRFFALAGHYAMRYLTRRPAQRE